MTYLSIIIYRRERPASAMLIKYNIINQTSKEAIVRHIIIIHGNIKISSALHKIYNLGHQQLGVIGLQYYGRRTRWIRGGRKKLWSRLWNSAVQFSLGSIESSFGTHLYAYGIRHCRRARQQVSQRQ